MEYRATSPQTHKADHEVVLVRFKGSSGRDSWEHATSGIPHMGDSVLRPDAL